MAITGVRGVTGSGRAVSASEISALSASIVQLNIETDDPRIPVARVQVDKEGNDEVRHFTRVMVTPSQKTLRIPVLEIRVKGSFVRLYLHPEQGPILSSQDLYSF